MNVLGQLYTGWLWQQVEGLDRLVLWPPLSPPDDPAAFARELYHRYLAHLLANRIWRLEWLAIFSAAIVLLLMPPLTVASAASRGWGILFGAIGVAVMAGIGAPWALGLILAPPQIDADANDAKALVRRVCLRDVPDGAPADLADPWRHGWMTGDGRPVAAEIAEFDLRSTELVRRAKTTFFAAAAIGLVPCGFSLIGFPALLLVLVIAICKAVADPLPVRVRARLLDVAAAGTAEGAAWAFAGASRWAERTEAARKAQLIESLRDKSPLLTLGKTQGLLAARGDPFGATAGLEMALSLDDLMQHLLVLGGTGSGKTAGVLRPLCKQIGALKDVGLVVMDGKGSLPGEIAAFVPDMIVIDPATTTMSLVEGLTPTEVVEVVSDLLGSPDGSGKFWDASASALMRHAAVMARIDDGPLWSLSGIWRIASEGLTREQLGNADLLLPHVNEAVDFFMKEWPLVEDKVKSNIVATLRSWYTTITGHVDTQKWADTPAGKSDIDVAEVLKGKRIGILAPAHRYGQAGPVVTALLKARIYAAIRDRADKGMREGETPIVLAMDEAQEITTQQDVRMLSLARSLKLSVAASTQTIEGIEARLGAKDAAQFLTLFGSVIALQNRSLRTAEAVAARIGSCFRPVLESVPGVPTVRSAAMAQRASGRLAAAKTQPAVAGTIEFGEGGRVRDLFAAINPFQLFRRTLGGEQERAHSRVAAAPLVTADEFNELVVEPDTALAVLTRARVPRRDVVKLRPIYG